MGMHRVYANVDDETFAELERRARDTHRSMSFLVRLGIDHVLNEIDPDREDPDGAVNRVRDYGYFGSRPGGTRSHPSSAGLRPVR